VTISTPQNDTPIHGLDELIREAKEVARASVGALRTATDLPRPQALIAAPGLPASLVVALPSRDERDAALTFCRLVPALIVGAKATACALVMYGKVYGSDQVAVLLLAASTAGVARYQRAELTDKPDGVVELGEWSEQELSAATEWCGGALAAGLGLYEPEQVVGSCRALDLAVRGRSFINAAASKAALEAAISTVASCAHAQGAEPAAHFFFNPAVPTEVHVAGRRRDVVLGDAVLAQLGGAILLLDPQLMSAILTQQALVQPLLNAGFTPEQSLSGELLEEHHQAVIARAQQAHKSLVAPASHVGRTVMRVAF
jgi:hypothetical protein